MKSRDTLWDVIKMILLGEKSLVRFLKPYFLFNDTGAFNIYLSLRRMYPQSNLFSGGVLSTCYNNAKHNFFIAQSSTHELPSNDTTQIVVFDFDGTLTSGKTAKTTWETLWTGLGYDIGLCKQFHQQYDQRNSGWC